MDHNLAGDAAIPGTRHDPDARLWAAFAAAGSIESLCRTWLGLQCRALDDVNGAMLLLARPGGPFAPVAVWPDASQDLSFLKSMAETCVQSGEPMVLHPPHDSGATGLHVAYPFLGDGGRPAGVVLLDLRPRPRDQVQPMLRKLHWGIGWLEAEAMRDVMGRERQRVAQAAAALDLVAVINEHERLEAAAIAVVNELAVRLGAARVALGLDAGRGARLAALSHTAWFKRKTTLVRALEAAMDEATDQRTTVRLPAAEGEAVRIQVAHEALIGVWGNSGNVTTFPLMSDRGPVGAITVLHAEAPADGVVRLGEAAAALLGPILDSKRRARRLVSGRIVDGVRTGLSAVAGPRHLGWKVAAGLAALAVTASVLITTDFRVSAKAVLEGKVQRAVPAPFEGFIATAPVHAGDVVHAGDLLATLDDKDLQLEAVKWRSERDRLLLKQRESLAKHDPVTTGQVEAQLRQTEAELGLTTEKLARTRILAPIDGLVVSGDLSQSLGAPVETGKVLFEIAPLDDYRVIVRVDERDVRFIRPGQRGHVLLHGLSEDAVDFTVARITSVAEAEGGRNTFRLEGTVAGARDGMVAGARDGMVAGARDGMVAGARDGMVAGARDGMVAGARDGMVAGAPEGTVAGASANLRPGMEGVGKIEVADRSFAWVWTRGLTDWVRMQLWIWTP